jgi:hypothetical protein
VTVSDGIETANDLVKITVDYGVGVNVEKTGSFAVYPNPVNDILKVELNSSDENNQVNIYSMDGKILLKGKINAGEKEKSFDLKKLREGVYFIQIENSKVREQQMVIKK